MLRVRLVDNLEEAFMIDENRLIQMTVCLNVGVIQTTADDQRELIRLARLGLLYETRNRYAPHTFNNLDEIDISGRREDIETMERLLRLGLWASTHGIPAMKEVEGSDDGKTMPLAMALAALPKEGK